MQFTSLFFVFAFLPISLVAYYLAPQKYKQYVLVIFSFLFYCADSVHNCVILFILIILTITIGRLILRQRRKSFRICLLILGCTANTTYLALYKYLPIISTAFPFTAGISSNLSLNANLLPLGISFYCFKAISYLADIYSGKITPFGLPSQDALYLSFFAQAQSGPISRFNDYSEPSCETVLFSEGACRFMVGFSKKILLANTFNIVVAEVFSASPDNYSVAFTWLGSLCFSLQLYYDFSGYSDMAIGLSEMLGYHCPENFNYPYLSSSISDFWRRWHITLGAWFRDYIYIPLGGSRSEHRWKLLRNLFIVWILTGLWHGAASNYLVWGIVYFLLVSFEHLFHLPQRVNNSVFKAIYRLFTLFCINILWVIFRANGLNHGLTYISHMFICSANAVADKHTLFLIKDYAIFLFAGILFCFPVIPWIKAKLKKTVLLSRFASVIYHISLLLIFLLSLSFVIAGQNNPFLYANF